MKLTDAKALVVGMEKSGRAAAEFLRAQGRDVTATDLKPHDDRRVSACRPTSCSTKPGI